MEGTNVNEDMACIVSLEEMLSIDSSIASLYDLPLGWVAYRSDINDDWKKESVDIWEKNNVQ